jgi:hypothetical protein
MFCATRLWALNPWKFGAHGAVFVAILPMYYLGGCE